MINNPIHVQNSNSIDWVICRDLKTFLNNIGRWREGWELAFGRRLSDSTLKRYFLDTPVGSPIVLLGIRDDKVVASSTLVPLYLKNPIDGHVHRYLQYIAAYILPGHSNGFSTYREMLGLIRNEVIGSNFKFVLSFPNANANALMTRIGGFNQIDVGYFIRGKLETNILHRLLSEINSPFFDDTLLAWRNHAGIKFESGALLKIFEGEINLLDVISPNFKSEIEGLLPWWSSWGEPPYEPVDNYRLSMCIYCEDVPPKIKRSFLLSDVF